MRHKFYTILIIILAGLSSQMVLAQSHLNGLYFHKPSGRILFTERVQNGLLVKEKENQSWRFFERSRPGLFFDNRGNRIEVPNEMEIIYVKRNSRRGRIYRKQIEPEFQRPVVSETRYDHSFCNRLEGLWYDEQNDIYVIVTDTREGIKVRLKDARTWFYFDRTTEYGFRFISAEGNTYECLDSTLKYTHHDKVNTLLFRKVSDSFDGY